MKKTVRRLLVLALMLTMVPLVHGQQDAAIQERTLEAIELVEVLPAPAEVPTVEDTSAEDTTTDTTTDTTEGTDSAEDTSPKPDADATAPGTLRFHLMDGSILTGKLQTATLPVKTEFGDLVVPITSIESFSPGLASHPNLDAEIQQLIQKLADPAAKERDRAQSQLISYGPGLIPELQRFADDSDAERKVRVATIIEELYGQEDDFTLDDGPAVSMVRLDMIVTAQFNVAGSIQQDTFNIESKFGKLVVKLADIKAAERVSNETPEVRRMVDVQGKDMAPRSYRNTGIRVNRGDKIIINAEGQITMTPWGNNVMSGPDGMPQNGMYAGKIPMGGLAGRIGDSGEEFMVGSKKSFVAKNSGTLYLGFAMQQNWANYQFPGKYEARVRVVPAE